MKKIVLITGIVGSGKSTVLNKLADHGFIVHELDDIQNLVSVRPEPSTSNPSTNKEEIEKQYNWTYKEVELKDYIAEHPGDVTIYSGVSGNIDKLAKLFTKVVLLRTSSQVIKSRLNARHETTELGVNDHSWTLNWKDNWEQNLIKNGAIAISSDKTVDQVVEEVIKSI